MQESSADMTRKDFVAKAVILPALAGLVIAETAPAQAKGSKAQFKYQDSPHNGQKCSGCNFFVPGSSAKANGTCKLVDGSISPNGWCTAYAPKK